MRLLFTIKSMSATYGGAERILALVANGLARRGHDVSVATFDLSSDRPAYDLDSRVQYLALGIGQADKPARFFETGIRIVHLRRLLRNIKPDIAIGFMHSVFVPLALSSLGSKVITIASEHIVPAHYKGKPGQYGLLLLATRLVDQVTVVSEQAYHLFPSFARRRMIVVPNPIIVRNTGASRPGTDRRSKSERRVILNIGRLTYQKDQTTLVRAFIELAPTRKEWILRIVGDGPLHSELQTIVDEHGLNDQIEFVDPHNNIDREYRDADILAVSSRYESFGMVTAEGLAHGLPVVGFAECPGTNVLINDGQNGVLASGTNRIEALRSALVELVDNEVERKRMSANARRSVRTYCPESVIEQWEKVCTKLCGNP